MRRLLILGSCLVAALVLAPTAQAAFPGTNGRIAFSAFDGADDEIYTVLPNGSGLQQLTFNNDQDEAPAWNATGTKIVFGRTLTGPTRREVWVMDADGGNAAPLFQENVGFITEDAPNPAFFPDGRVVFVRIDPVAPFDPEIWAINADGTGLIKLTDNNQDDLDPTVSPSGALIAIARGTFASTSIFTIGGFGDTQLTNFGNDFLDQAPNFSPGGGTIAFNRCAGGEGCESDSPTNLETVPTFGGGVTQLTSFTTPANDPDACDPAYAPDATLLVFGLMKAQAAFTTNCSPSSAVSTSVDLFGLSTGVIQPVETGFTPDWQPVPVTSPTATAATGGRCRGVTATINGTPGPDELVGTPGPDVIQGYRGKDKIHGFGADDRLCGARGEDKIYGEEGDDTLFGGAQSDYLNGGPGKNHLFGGTPKAKPDKEKNVCVVGPNDSQSNCQVIE